MIPMYVCEQYAVTQAFRRFERKHSGIVFWPNWWPNRHTLPIKVFNQIELRLDLG